MGYSSTIVNNDMFVGHEDILNDIMNGLKNGESYAIIGGRRCGKTSILRKIEEVLKIPSKIELFNVKPCYIDAQGLDDFTVRGVFREIYSQTVKGLCNASWLYADNGHDYDNFKKHLDQIKPMFESKYGDNWLVVLLIDELDMLSTKLNNDLFFQNLRNFLMNSDFARNFRLITTGVKILSNLISHGSPLNNLKYKYLEIVSEKAADNLICKGFPYGFRPEVREYFVDITGRHPYIMQGICENLPRNGNAVDEMALYTAKTKFQEEHRDFNTWRDGFSETECTIYHLLAESKDSFLTGIELKDAIHPSLISNVQDSLTTLRYHGVIDRTDKNKPNKIAGTIFKKWFEENLPKDKIKLSEKALKAALIKSTEDLLEAVNGSALGNEELAKAQEALNDAISKLKDDTTDISINKNYLRTTFDKTLEILKTAGPIIKDSANIYSALNVLGTSIGWAAGFLSGTI
ncbi:MAG: hypothetical protein HQK89_00450 [Nitrospirae bacterium]|nr:hypothetical protein [Nitrospirota bacterium]